MFKTISYQKNQHMKQYFYKKQTGKVLYFTKSLLLFFILIILFAFSNSVFAQEQHTDDVLTKTNDDIYRLKDMEINTSNRTVTIPCTINMAFGLIEVVLCRPEGKTHESLLTTKISPLEFQTALLLLGLDPVNEMPDDRLKADSLSPYKTIETPGDSVVMFIELAKDGNIIRKPTESFIRDERTKSAINHTTWLFKGAVTHRSGYVIVDPNVTMISTYYDPIALMELNSSAKYDDELFFVNEASGLTKGQPVKLIIQAINK
jgi:hypothetical protein